MCQNCQDALALNRHYKGADLFLTATANPSWPEIQRELLPGQTAADRPDLVTRVFKLKMDELKKDIEKHNILGVSVARVYTIEFQKCGLPHMHMIIFLHHDSKLETSEDVDSLISAEFPDPEEEPELFELVKKLMVHGPCGELNKTSPCMEGDKCIRNFPKPFKTETTLFENAYASYHRHDDGKKYTVGRQQLEVDNRWVVPYCKFLLWKYRCHINLESVISIKSIKYIYKYVYKGHDHTTVEFGKNVDEAKHYLDARYVCACEAHWRLFQFCMHEEKPAVV